MSKFWLCAYSLALVLSIVILVGFIFGAQLSKLTIGVSLVTTVWFFYNLVNLERTMLKIRKNKKQ